MEVRETTFAGHAEVLATAATKEGFPIILSAGGDGTMHQILNGVLAAGIDTLPVLGLIPLGSGNDLARPFAIKADAIQISRLLQANDPGLIDIGCARTTDTNGVITTRYFINECSIGMGPEVVRRMNDTGRSSAAALMYLKAIVSTFFMLKPEWIEVKSETFNWSGMSRVLAVANGRCFGHGIFIAPEASVNDGQLNVFLAANPGLLRFITLLQQLKKPRQSKASCLHYFTTKKVLVTSKKPLPVEGDGEPIGFTPLECEIKSQKVKFFY